MGKGEKYFRVLKERVKKEKKKDYDKRVHRLIRILNLLDSGSRVSSKTLAEEFNIHVRSVQRDLDLLNRTGFPLFSPEKGIYSFAEGFSLKKVRMTQEDASLLSFLYEIAKTLGGKFEVSFHNILNKIISPDADSPFYAKIPQGIKLDADLPFIKELEKAIDESRKVEFYYLTQGNEKWLRVCPLKIAFFDGFWYLVVRVDHKDWILKLRIENIRKLNVLDESFEIPRNLQAMLDQSVNVWFSEKRDKKITVKVKPEAAKYFKTQTCFPLQKIVKENKDGSLIIESTVCQDMEAMRIVFRWFPWVQVLRPLQLKKQVCDTVRMYLMK